VCLCACVYLLGIRKKVEAKKEEARADAGAGAALASPPWPRLLRQQMRASQLPGAVASTAFARYVEAVN